MALYLCSNQAWVSYVEHVFTYDLALTSLSTNIQSWDYRWRKRVVQVKHFASLFNSACHIFLPSHLHICKVSHLFHEHLFDGYQRITNVHYFVIIALGLCKSERFLGLLLQPWCTVYLKNNQISCAPIEQDVNNVPWVADMMCDRLCKYYNQLLWRKILHQKYQNEGKIYNRLFP